MAYECRHHQVDTAVAKHLCSRASPSSRMTNTPATTICVRMVLTAFGTVDAQKRSRTHGGGMQQPLCSMKQWALGGKVRLRECRVRPITRNASQCRRMVHERRKAIGPQKKRAPLVPQGRPPMCGNGGAREAETPGFGC